MCLCLCVNNTNLHSKVCVSKTKFIFHICMYALSDISMRAYTHTYITKSHALPFILQHEPMSTTCAAVMFFENVYAFVHANTHILSTCIYIYG